MTRITKKGITGGALKTALNFVVTVNSLTLPDHHKIVAAFAHPSDAQKFAGEARVGRPDLTYHIVAGAGS